MNKYPALFLSCKMMFQSCKKSCSSCSTISIMYKRNPSTN